MRVEPDLVGGEESRIVAVAHTRLVRHRTTFLVLELRVHDRSRGDPGDCAVPAPFRPRSRSCATVLGQHRAHRAGRSRDGGRDGEEGRARHRVEQGVRRILHEPPARRPAPPAPSRRHRRRAAPTARPPTTRGPAHRAALANITSIAGRWRFTRGPLAEPGHAARGEQVEVGRCDVDPARRSGSPCRACAAGSGPDRARIPGRLLRRVASDVHRDEHARGQVRRQGRDELDQRLDPARRAADRQHGTVVRSRRGVPRPGRRQSGGCRRRARRGLGSVPRVCDQGRSEDVGEPAGPGVRGAAGAPEGQPRIRLHRLQALQPDAPRRPADGAGRDRDYADYLDHLELHPDEFTALFNTILINVTGFFRDPEAWEHLARGGPARAARQRSRPASRCGCGARAAPPGRRPTRWPWCSPSCSGSRSSGDRVKIYATDVDEEALTHARQAGYTEREVRAIPPELLERYFEPHRRPLRLPQGPAPLGDLRPQRPGAGRADLPASTCSSAATP